MGEGGDRLSTGEKQLISFARAVLADPRIFVLDEATSSIDTQTEQLIQNAIDHLLHEPHLLSDSPPSVHHPQGGRDPCGEGRPHRGAGQA